MITQINVAIVDDSNINRALLKLLLKDWDKIKIVAEGSDGNKAIELLLLLNSNIDLIIMDIEMPNMNGIAATKRIKKIAPDMRILCNSYYTNTNYIEQMIKAGASGYIRKDSTLNSYKEAINTVVNYGIYLLENDDVEDKIYDEIFTRLKASISTKKYKN